MTTFSPLLQQLIQAMRCLPGVGPKSAQRMAFHLLEHRKEATLLEQSIQTAMAHIKHCERCRNYAETAYCTLCNNPKRDESLLCIVETPADVVAIESSHSYRGLYFVLHGHLSPLDGIGPEALGLDKLETIFKEANVNEVIIATNPTTEGEATAFYIARMAKKQSLNTSRIAHGVPIGGELEYIDGNTLALALQTRKVLED